MGEPIIEIKEDQAAVPDNEKVIKIIVTPDPVSDVMEITPEQIKKQIESSLESIANRTAEIETENKNIAANKKLLDDIAALGLDLGNLIGSVDVITGK